jgi:hypothetical protein
MQQFKNTESLLSSVFFCGLSALLPIRYGRFNEVCNKFERTGINTPSAPEKPYLNLGKVMLCPGTRFVSVGERIGIQRKA